MSDIFVYAVNVSALDPDSACWAGLLSSARARRLAEVRVSAERRRSLGAELALHAALTAHATEYCPPPRYRYQESGKPRLLTDEWHISLAHAGDWAVCALSDAPVGVDIERAGRASPLPVHAWVGVESYLKLTGEGLSGGFRTLCATEEAVFRLGRRLAFLARAQVGDCLLCAASDTPATLSLRVVEAASLARER